MAEKKLKNMYQFTQFNGDEFCKGKTFRVISDPTIGVKWENGKATKESECIRLIADVWHDETQYLDKNDNPIEVDNLDCPVAFKIKLPDELSGKDPEDEEVQQFLADCPLHTNDIFEVKHAIKYYYAMTYGLSVTFKDKHGFNWLSHFTR